jgi:hypothetical protein
MGFREAKRRLLEALDSGSFQHAVRDEIDEKNLLLTGKISAGEVRDIVLRCNGSHHSEAPHHMIPGIPVHVLRRDGWYIKFYFIDADTFFLSVHK